MARRKREAIDVERWSTDAGSVWSGMADWRAAHPKATFGEIEAALDERLNQVRARVRARVLADLALASAAADLQVGSKAERPRCGQCGVMLLGQGQSERGVVTQGGAEVRLRRSYATCPQCGERSFPPGR